MPPVGGLRHAGHPGSGGRLPERRLVGRGNQIGAVLAGVVLTLAPVGSRAQEAGSDLEPGRSVAPEEAEVAAGDGAEAADDGSPSGSTPAQIDADSAPEAGAGESGRQAGARGGEAGTELELFALDDLMMAQTQVASQQARPLRESPAVVSLVTREEITNSGARDLRDVLQLVPGIFLGTDVQGAVGIGFRGLWGHEGKVLLLLDGQEMNEHLYSTNQLGNHYPADLIEKVEVLRGPGSALYGGYAGLAVVNVVSRRPEGGRGFGVSVTGGTFGSVDVPSRGTVSGYGGWTFPEAGDLALNLAFVAGRSEAGIGEWRDFVGGSYELYGNSAANPLLITGGLRWGALEARLVVDRYTVGTRDGFGEVSDTTDVMDFPLIAGDVKYTWRINDALTMTPQLWLKHEEPWRTADVASAFYFRKSVMRARARDALEWRLAPDLTWVVGAEGWVDSARVIGSGGLSTLFGDKDHVTYLNAAGFTELAWYGPWLNVTAGGRLEWNSAVGASLAPRLALSRMFGPVHLKALGSGAFRAPGIENINLGTDVRPERTTVFEVEGGWQVHESVYLSANAFDVSVGQPIVYFTDPDGDTESYQNFTRTGTRGVEVEGRLRQGWGYVTAAYSFYTATESDVESYKMPGRPEAFLGLPNHRVSVLGHVKLGESLSLDPTVHLFGARHALAGWDAEDAPLFETHGPMAMIHVVAHWKNFYTRGLTASAGVYNVLGTPFRYLQPYTGGHPGLATQPREFLVKLSWTPPVP